MKLKGLSAIVTGSLRGIGLAILKALAKEGCNAVINDIHPESDAIELQREIEETYGVRCYQTGRSTGNGEGGGVRFWQGRYFGQ